MKFYQNLIRARENKGYSKQETAKAVGVTYSSYRAYETGRGEPKYDTLKRIAEFLDVSTDSLLGVNINKKNTFKIFSERIRAFHNKSHVELVDNDNVLLCLDFGETEATLRMNTNQFMEMCSRSSNTYDFKRAIYRVFCLEYTKAASCNGGVYDMLPEIEEPIDTSDPNDFSEFDI